MSEVKHTPGPWRLHSEDLRGGTYWVVTMPGAEETIDIFEGDNGEANAHLIFAAPDLLAACRALDAALCAGFETKATRHAGRMALIAARAAIAKATCA